MIQGILHGYFIPCIIFSICFRSGQFPSLCNTEKVDLDHPEEEDLFLVKQIVQDHYSHTGSSVAKKLLENWSTSINYFVKV